MKRKYVDNFFVVHEITVIPAEKLDGGIIGYRWSCSCPRGTGGLHKSPDAAFERGRDHFRMKGSN